jgi:hypothetical protein
VLFRLKNTLLYLMRHFWLPVQKCTQSLALPIASTIGPHGATISGIKFNIKRLDGIVLVIFDPALPPRVAASRLAFRRGIVYRLDDEIDDERP